MLHPHLPVGDGHGGGIVRSGRRRDRTGPEGVARYRPPLPGVIPAIAHDPWPCRASPYDPSKRPRPARHSPGRTVCNAPSPHAREDRGPPSSAWPPCPASRRDSMAAGASDGVQWPMAACSAEHAAAGAWSSLRSCEAYGHVWRFAGGFGRFALGVAAGAMVMPASSCRASCHVGAAFGEQQQRKGDHAALPCPRHAGR